MTYDDREKYLISNNVQVAPIIIICSIHYLMNLEFVVLFVLKKDFDTHSRMEPHGGFQKQQANHTFTTFMIFPSPNL